jgi:hypothetical protein
MAFGKRVRLERLRRQLEALNEPQDLASTKGLASLLREVNPQVDSTDDGSSTVIGLAQLLTAKEHQMTL